VRELGKRAAEPVVLPSDEYLAELNEAYNHFFFHYSATPLLVVETSHIDLSWGDDALDELLRQLKSLTHGTRYFVPRT
jgi:deoxyadenosine/deoxycytidine kinase